MGVSPTFGLELCAGIGALGVGVARAIPGYRTVVAVENEAPAVAVLVARQQDGSLPPFPIWDDLKTFDGRAWRGVVDIVVAGFPCQDISLAGKGTGIHGERSGLWFDVLRVIREVRPRYVFLENVAALVIRGLDTVAGGLASECFDAEWGCLRASDVGAPHGRNRWWCLAWDREQLADPVRIQLWNRGRVREVREAVADFWPPAPNDEPGWLRFVRGHPDLVPATERPIRRGSDGPNPNVDRLRGLGNAVVPQQAEAALRLLWHRAFGELP